MINQSKNLINRAVFPELFDEVLMLNFPKVFSSLKDFEQLNKHSENLIIHEDLDKVVVEVLMPGLSHDDISIEIRDGILEVVGTMKGEDDQHQKIRSLVKNINVKISLPQDVDFNSDPEASLNHGILKLVFVKKQSDKVRKISLKSA